MLRLPSLGELDRGIGVKIFLCTAPTDMRKGFDTLAVLVRDFLGHDPLSGHLFLFISRRRDRMKILYWDADGFAMWYKRLGLADTSMARARCDTIRLKLLKIGAAVKLSVRRVRVSLASGYPLQALFRQVLARLMDAAERMSRSLPGAALRPMRC